MCGRYSFYTGGPDERLIAIYQAMERHYAGQYKTGDIFPGDTAPAVIRRENRIVAVPGVFGLPGFQSGRLLINARSETAGEKPTFADSLRRRRAIIPATGFYEWDSQRTKYLFSLEGAHALYLCGLYQVVEGRVRFVILTRAANASMAQVHSRMPVMVPPEQVRPWLTDYAAACGLLDAEAPALTKQEA